MNLKERLQQQQRVKQRNSALAAERLNSSAEATHSRSATNPLQISSSQSLGLERIRGRQKTPHTKQITPNLLVRNEFEGSVEKMNPQGSYLYFEHNGRVGDLLHRDELGSMMRHLVRILGKSDCPVDLNRMVFVDTETTGLSGGTGTYAFLVGIGGWNSTGLQVEQYLMRGYDEESAVLEAVHARLCNAQVLLTFNGKSFDIPLLQSRFVLARRPWPLPSALHVDLIHPARRLWSLRLGDCSLGNLENKLLARTRCLDVPGNEIPSIYFNYSRTGNPSGIRAILQHNRQDIETLAELTIKISEILGGETPTDSSAEDLFSTGRYFRSLGEKHQALACAELALKKPLSRELELEVLVELAKLRKARREYQTAADFWRTVFDRSMKPREDVCEELAIYYEHRGHNLSAALNVVEVALSYFSSASSQQKWEHRRQRLLRKLKGRSFNASLFDGALI